MKNYIGIDWNGYSKTEGTTVLVLRKDADKFCISTIHRLSPGMPFTTQIEQISRMILNYRAARVGADIGIGAVQCQMLQRDFGQRIASVYYSSSEEDMRYNSENWMITCNRDRNIAKALKKVGFPFTCFRAELGDGVFSLSTASEFHALNYAYLASRLDKLSEKIKVGDSVRTLKTVSSFSSSESSGSVFDKGAIGSVEAVSADGALIKFDACSIIKVSWDFLELVDEVEEPPIFPQTEAKVEEWIKFLQTFDPQIGQLSDAEIGRMEPSAKMALVNVAIERDKLREEQFKRKMKAVN